MEKKRTYGVWAVRSSTSIFGPAQSWCKENGKPLEFDTKAAAENYAKEANEHTTANVRYYVKEKEPEPGAVRKGTSQPELDARSHEEVIPRNDAAEKQNEIPGRQIPSQTDPLVEIRSAVHSNYAGMVAMLGADNRVYLGHEERCHYSWYICYVTLENKNLSHLPVSLLSEEQMSRYSIYMSTLGNRPDLFPDSPYVLSLIHISEPTRPY